MITIHSDHDWIKPYTPNLFKVRHCGQVSDFSTGSIVVVSFYHHPENITDIIASLSDRYRHAIIYVCEPWPGFDWLGPIIDNSPGNVMFLSDIVGDEQQPATHRYVGNWFMTHNNLYNRSRYCQQRLSELRDDLDHKPYRFDALLGVVRPHRVLVHELWQQSKYKDEIFLTFHGPNAEHGIWHDPHVIVRTDWGQDNPDPGMLKSTPWTYVGHDDGQGSQIGTQNIVPVQIFNDTWFSLITEGYISDMGTRLTEKIAKAFVAKRFFVYFGAHKDLARMTRLGFQTFGHIVDESYDNIQDDTHRWRAAWQVVEWVCQQDPLELNRATESVRLHNQQVFLHTDWYASLRQHMREICTKY